MRHKHRSVRTPSHDGFRRDGRLAHLHDVLLADSETVRGRDRRLSRFDRRRSCRDGCRCRRCRSCSGRCCSRRCGRTGWGGGSAAAGTGSAASAGGAGSSTTTAVASVGSVGSGSSAGGGSVSPPSSPSPSSAANGGGARRQPDPPSNGSGDGAGAVDPPIATITGARNTMARRRERFERKRGHAGSPPSVSSALSSIGGEPLAGSGFESQSAQRGFAPASVNASDGATPTGSGSVISLDRAQRNER